MYVVAAILRNALTCMHTNNTSKFFEVVSPAIDEYFEENTKKNHKRVVSVYVIQIHVDLHKL